MPTFEELFDRNELRYRSIILHGKTVAPEPYKLSFFSKVILNAPGLANRERGLTSGSPHGGHRLLGRYNRFSGTRGRMGLAGRNSWGYESRDTFRH